MDTRTSASCSSAKWVRGYSSIGIESVRVRNTTAPARSSSVVALSATASVATCSPAAFAVLHPVDVGCATVQAHGEAPLPLRDLVGESRRQWHSQGHRPRPGGEPHRAHDATGRRRARRQPYHVGLAYPRNRGTRKLEPYLIVPAGRLDRHRPGRKKPVVSPMRDGTPRRNAVGGRGVI